MESKVGSGTGLCWAAHAAVRAVLGWLSIPGVGAGAGAGPEKGSSVVQGTEQLPMRTDGQAGRLQPGEQRAPGAAAEAELLLSSSRSISRGLRTDRGQEQPDRCAQQTRAGELPRAAGRGHGRRVPRDRTRAPAELLHAQVPTGLSGGIAASVPSAMASDAGGRKGDEPPKVAKHV